MLSTCHITTDVKHLYNPLMKFDIVIIGGGIVGASMALALKDSGLKIALVESHLPSLSPKNKSWDSRVYAISPGSASFLDNLNVWSTIDKDRVTPVYEMAVFGDDNSANLNLSAYDSGIPELAFILENCQLQSATWSALQDKKTKVKIFCPMQCNSIEWEESYANIKLTNDMVLQAALVIGADGLNSWVREQAGIDVTQHSYQQSGVVANFSTEYSHQNTAHQWFRRDGVLALLPLPDKLVSMVWSANDDLANKLVALPEADLCQKVDEATCHTMGKLHLITRPVAFPLNCIHVKTLIQPRLALVGDAAHGIHPLAGQGMNLGLRDACELARTIAGRGSQSDCGDYMLLRRYERTRREDILAMELTTDSLQKLFNNENPTLARLRNLGLEITNHIPLIKKHLIQHAIS